MYGKLDLRTGPLTRGEERERKRGSLSFKESIISSGASVLSCLTYMCRNTRRRRKWTWKRPCRWTLHLAEHIFSPLGDSAMRLITWVTRAVKFICVCVCVFVTNLVVEFFRQIRKGDKTVWLTPPGHLVTQPLSKKTCTSKQFKVWLLTSLLKACDFNYANWLKFNSLLMRACFLVICHWTTWYVDAVGTAIGKTFRLLFFSSP